MEGNISKKPVIVSAVVMGFIKVKLQCICSGDKSWIDSVMVMGKVLSVNRDLHIENALKRIKVFPFSRVKTSRMGNSQ